MEALERSPMTEEELKKMDEKVGDSNGFVFMKEEIKPRPTSKRRIAHNTLLAASSAVVFGIVACVTFALIAPFVMDRVADKDSETVTPSTITFPEETADEEMSPKDMLVVPEEETIDYSEIAALEEEEIKNLLSKVTFTVTDYQKLYRSFSEIAQNFSKSLVKVTSVITGTDWMNSMYENSSDLTGLIIADSGSELFIVTKYSGIQGYDNIIVTFANDVQAEATLVNYDSGIDMAVISVADESINEVTRDAVSPASLGSSAPSNLAGSPVIAVGSPMGSYGSVNYGMITSTSSKISVVDNYYKQLLTNIYGSKNATGVIINLKGEVLGLIDTKFQSEDNEGIVSAIGITELKKTFERLTNRRNIVMLGIEGGDVPNEAIYEGVPDGVYVLSVDFNTPAMVAGIQNGDIITKIGETEIGSFSDFLSALSLVELDSTVKVVVKRSVQAEYKEITMDVYFDRYNK